MSEPIITQLEDKCASCGCAHVEAESRSHRHCNGFWNERRSFKCGRTTEFSPNFMSIYVTSECRTVTELIAAARRTALDEVLVAVRAVVDRHRLGRWGDLLIQTIATTNLNNPEK